MVQLYPWQVEVFWYVTRCGRIVLTVLFSLLTLYISDAMPPILHPGMESIDGGVHHAPFRIGQEKVDHQGKPYSFYASCALSNVNTTGCICCGQLKFDTVPLIRFNTRTVISSILPRKYLLTLNSLRECHNSAK